MRRDRWSVWHLQEWRAQLACLVFIAWWRRLRFPLFCVRLLFGCDHRTWWRFVAPSERHSFRYCFWRSVALAPDSGGVGFAATCCHVITCVDKVRCMWQDSTCAHILCSDCFAAKSAIKKVNIQDSMCLNFLPLARGHHPGRPSDRTEKHESPS